MIDLEDDIWSAIMEAQGPDSNARCYAQAAIGVLTSDANLTTAAARIMDVFMGGHTGWRDRMDDSLILESADWARAVELARAAIGMEQPS